MKVGYMTGVLMGDTSNQTSNGQSNAPVDTSVTNPNETFVAEDDEKDGGDEDNGGGDDGSFSFLNTNMIIYVVLGLVLFKAFKK
jgi:hypothetical protein